MKHFEIYWNDECDTIKINISEEEVPEQAEKTQSDEVKRIQSVQKLKFRTQWPERACNATEKQGCFPRLKNFPVPKYESEMNTGNADLRAEDATMDELNLRMQDQTSCSSLPSNLPKSPNELRE